MKRLAPVDRKIEILEAAIKIAARPGAYAKLTRAAVALEAQCAEGLVSKYFGTMLCFRRTIMRAAIARQVYSLIAQGIACGDPTALKAPHPLKEAALKNLAR